MSRKLIEIEVPEIEWEWNSETKRHVSTPDIGTIAHFSLMPPRFEAIYPGNYLLGDFDTPENAKEALELEHAAKIYLRERLNASFLRV